MICTAGIGLTFGVWWVYDTMPSAKSLERDRGRVFTWAFCQLGIIVAIVASGAGLHVVAYSMEHHNKLGDVAALLCALIPLTLFFAGVYGLHAYLLRRVDRRHVAIGLVTLAILGGTLIAALLDVSVPVCLLIMALAPVATIVGYEAIGYRGTAEALPARGAGGRH